METPDWLHKSLCRNRHIDFWYPPLDTETPDKYYNISRAVCNQCPVWRDCLDAGLNEVWGMWGGLTPQERTVLTSKTPKQTAFREHGTKTRYRQGCSCTDCETENANRSETLDINMVPKMSETLGDLDILNYLIM